MRSLYFLIGFFFCWSCGSHEELTEKDIAKAGSQYSSVLNWMGHWKARWGKEKMALQMARNFELTHQDIKVNMQFPQDFYKIEEYFELMADSVAEMIRTNNYTWDIIFLDVSHYNRVASRLKDPDWGSKYLVDFEEFDWFRNNHKSFIFENPQYRNFTGGQFVGPVIEGIYTALWYNKKVADKIGISVKPENMTFDDFKGYLKAAFDYNKTAQQKITLITNESQNNVNILFSNLVISELGGIDSINIDLAKSKEALRKGLKAFEEISVYNPLELVHGKENITLLDEKNLFVVVQTYAYNRWAGIDFEKTGNLVPVELPGLEKPTTVYAGTYQSVWCAFKNSPNVNNAIKAMQFICTNDVAEQWLSLTKNPTGLKTRLNSTDLAQSNVERFIAGIDNKYGKNIQNDNLAQILFGSKNRRLPIRAEAVLKGEMSAEQCFNSIVKDIR